MGQTLSSPDTEKHSKSGGDDKFLYGLCEMQGWRISMEDAHTIELSLEDNKGGKNSFFAVYDGHGGGTVARFSGENVHKRLVSDEAYQEQQWESALKKAFLGTDEDIRAGEFWDPSGCTAVAALVTDDGRIFVANAGDSRSVISVKGEVKPLSFDHKPLNETEMTRIRNAGGYVEYGRVNGNLALSRAIGDFEFKKNVALAPEDQIITANPDVMEHHLTEEDEFLVLACDGIWDCLSSQQVVDIIRLQISERKELAEISEFICEHCLAPDTTSGAGVGCDNMTILIIALLNGRTKEQWYDWIADRVKQGYGYPTPSEIPQLYAPSRLSAFRARRQAYEERMARDRASESDRYPGGNQDNNGGVFGGRGVGGPTSALGFARAMLGGGIGFNPSTGIVGDDGAIMFSGDDSDDDSEEDVEMGLSGGRAGSAQSFLSSLGLRQPSSDVTKSLKAQLDELDMHEPGSQSRFEQFSDDDEIDAQDGTIEKESEDEDQPMSDPGDEAQQAFGAQTKSGINSSTPNGFITESSGEAPPPPASLVNGDMKVKQLSSPPGGDEASPVVKAEGLMDSSESPLKG